MTNSALVEDALATPQGTVRVGVDLAEVAAMRRSLERFGERFVRRVFTDHEAASCRAPLDPTGYAVDSLAARFAAKEAALKVLRPSGGRPEWRSIEVRRHDDGWCEIVLSGEAARLAGAQGLGELAVSLTHEGPLAAAVVAARAAHGR
jgi:holo-[acyl-carrier protein] synthase